MKVDCVHHWMIEASLSDTSRGRCKKCGAEKDFVNTADTFDGFQHFTLKGKGDDEQYIGGIVRRAGNNAG
jgi:hypothetical protein